ncbi:MAG TPA: bifunctional alpha,alpha-trehalose-phosphate synthase (UDP-forming)/trehalose-phosphatase [Prolixibacteraceae bacterium]|nr:bifunctional alpha,alpha-trehalose-phosphate synthase (UDP-forming)/trehalose-phosphatase [Prolixibacteraceae bacterium]
MALYIISNRLPLKVSKTDNEYVYERSEGGLATGLSSIQNFAEKKWIGWPGIFSDNEEEKEEIRAGLLSENFHPVFLSEDQIRDYYEGYSNSMIWPLCHYFYTYIQYETKFWKSYQYVNQLFCDEAVKILKPGDMVWIQDYQLMLLPALLRERIEGISIGYFHHIPFPSYELFRVLPERAEILKGLLGADLIGFHTHDYMRHFISAAYRVLGLDSDLDEIHYNDRVIHVDAFPMGINYDLHHDAILDKTVQKMANQFRQNFGNHKLALSVDRLDYSKGILHRLKGFSLFLERHPEYRGKVSLVMVVVPSRDKVDRYADLKTKIDEMIGAVNGTYSSLDWRPIYYFYHGFPFEELMALYHIANFALVTPLRDGMNLVAKEYVAVKRDNPGVLILSEMAGVAAELKEALIINPNDVEEIEAALLEAMLMPEPEQKKRMLKMQKTVSKQSVNKWASDFVTELNEIKMKNFLLQNKKIDIKSLKQIIEQYKRAKKRLLILDYDGTLVPIMKLPELAIPEDQLMQTLKALAADKRNSVVISSGRDADFLDKWFGELGLNLAAEHGAFYKAHGKWIENSATTFPEDDELSNIMQQIVDKTPGSRLEIKKTSMVWHYRNCDKWLADLREKQLIHALMMPCARLNLQIMRGTKVIEVKTVGFNKGTEAVRLMETDDYDFVMAMGDDITDEDMFHVLPAEAVTIKVGSISDYARFSMPQHDTINFLNSLM